MKSPEPKILLIVKTSLIEQIVITPVQLHKDNCWRVFRATLYSLQNAGQIQQSLKKEGVRGERKTMPMTFHGVSSGLNVFSSMTFQSIEITLKINFPSKLFPSELEQFTRKLLIWSDLHKKLVKKIIHFFRSGKK